MKLRLAAIGSAMLLAAAAASGPASADTMWDFFTLTGSQPTPGADLGSTHASWTQLGETLTAISATSSGCGGGLTWCPGSADLYAKNGGSTAEQGLGLAADPYGSGGEIYYPNGIYFAIDMGTVTSISIGSLQGSTQAGEGWAVLGWNNTTHMWDTLGSGMSGNMGVVEDFTDPSLADYSQFIVDEPNSGTINGSNDNVLMDVTTVPEPGALALFGAGLLGCALFVGRRRRSQQS